MNMKHKGSITPNKETHRSSQCETAHPPVEVALLVHSLDDTERLDLSDTRAEREGGQEVVVKRHD